MNYSLCPDLLDNQLGNLCIEVCKRHPKPYVVTTWYRSPDSSSEIFAYFESLIGRFDAQNVELYVMGDLNCNLPSSTLFTDWKC